MSVFGTTSDQDNFKQTSRLSRAGTIRKIGPKLYTRNLQEPPEAIVLRNLWRIVALIAPGAIVSYRTAFENRSAPDGSILVTGDYQRNVALPGITIRQIAGVGPQSGDIPYMGELHLASRPRCFLENLLPTRKRDMIPKSVGRKIRRFQLKTP